jgi:hypothetical protein
MYVCEECGDSLPARSSNGHRTRSDALYCSPRCRVKAHRHANPRNASTVAEKPCAVCGALFRPTRGNQTMCDSNQSCVQMRSQRMLLLYEVEQAESARWDAICAREGCDNNAGWMGSGRPRKFCSDRCKTAHYRAQRKASVVTGPGISADLRIRKSHILRYEVFRRSEA